MDRKKYIDVVNKIDLSNKDRATLINLFDEIGKGESSSSGTSNYEDLHNKPSINNIELKGNKSLNDLGIANKDDVLTKKEQVLTSEEKIQVQKNIGINILVGNINTILDNINGEVI